MIPKSSIWNITISSNKDSDTLARFRYTLMKQLRKRNVLLKNKMIINEAIECFQKTLFFLYAEMNI